MGDASPTNADEELFDLLESYLDDLHQGKQPDRSRFAKLDGGSRALLDCLDALDALVPAEESELIAQAALESGEQPTRNWQPGQEAKDEGLIVRMQTVTQPDGDFGPYELLEEIGRGGMGVVIKARQKSLDRIVALKMILASHLATEQHVKRFYIEARAAARLRHPNIVAIHEIGEINGQHFFAMQHIEGDSLTDLLRDGDLDIETAVELMVSIARAVDYLHREGIVHRDLKPSNILIDNDGTPYVTDFGLAKFFATDSDLTESGMIAGTPSYMAPEQAAARQEDVGPLSDVYSLGAILYQLLTGSPPFRAGSPLDTIVQVIESEPQPPRSRNPAVPVELERICLRCLEKSPQNRYPDAGALADDLERYLRGEEVEARPTSLDQRLRRWVRRKPALASRLIGLAAAAIVLEVNYSLWPIYSPVDHFAVLGVLALWAVTSILCQRLLSYEWNPHPVRFAWAASDVIFLTAALIVGGAPPGPLLVGYPLLIAGSGLWFHVRLVVFMTGITLLTYGVFLWSQPNLVDVHHHVIFALTLPVMGFIVGYQVFRVRALSRYYRSRRLP